MFFTITRLGLALGAPALITAQSLTTYAVTISNSVHELVLRAPQVATVTEYVTNGIATTTIIPPASIETYIFTVTGPPPEVTSIANSIPSGARVLGDVSSEAPGAIVPIVIQGFTTSIQIPATASIPTGSATFAPVNIVAPTPPALSSAFVAPSSAVPGASSAASQEAVVASNVAGSATTVAASAPASAASNIASVASSVATTIDNIPTHLPIPIIPLLSISASMQSASSAAANGASTAVSAPSLNPDSSALSATATNAISSALQAISSEVSQTSVGTAIISDTTILSATNTATTTTGTATQTTMMTSTSSTAPTTSAPSSSAAPSSSSSSVPPPPPSSSSTAAPPKSGAGRLESVWRGGVGVAAGLAAVAVAV